jgi:hypothetical protein
MHIIISITILSMFVDTLITPYRLHYSIHRKWGYYIKDITKLLNINRQNSLFTTSHFLCTQRVWRKMYYDDDGGKYHIIIILRLGSCIFKSHCVLKYMEYLSFTILFFAAWGHVTVIFMWKQGEKGIYDDKVNKQGKDLT